MIFKRERNKKKKRRRKKKIDFLGDGFPKEEKRDRTQEKFEKNEKTTDTKIEKE